MYEVLYVVLGVILAAIIFFVLRLVGQNASLKQELEDSMSMEEIVGYVREVKESMGFIARGHQLSTIFEIGSASLKVNPEDFAPKKDEIRRRILKEVVEQDHNQPSTWAFCVLTHTGWKEFVTHDTYTKAEKALARLRANDDKEAILAFVNDLVDQLSPEPAVA